MPRRRADDRLEQICEAALTVFSAKGYRRARMNEIADAAGVAPGTLYLYVEGKEALFLLVVEWLSLRESLPTAFPVKTPRPGETVRILRKGLGESVRPAALRRATTSSNGDDIREELGSIVDELYTAIHRNRRLLALIERSAADWPELYEAYFIRDRRAFHRQVAGYLERAATDGRIKPVSDPAVAARFLVESIGWMAWKRMNDVDGANLDEGAVRGTLRELLVSAFAPE